MWTCPEFPCLCFCIPPCPSPWETAPFCRRWPFCGSRWHCWAVTSHPLPSAACLPPPTLSPSSCLPHSLFHSPCVLSVVFGNGVITGQPISHFLRCAVCLLSLSLSLPSSLSFNPPASELPMAVVCHLYTQDTLSLTDVTHNALRGCHLISIPCSLSPSPTRMMWVKRVSNQHGTTQKCKSRKRWRKSVLTRSEFRKSDQWSEL